jgi:hypothetical protein
MAAKFNTLRFHEPDPVVRGAIQQRLMRSADRISGEAFQKYSGRNCLCQFLPAETDGTAVRADCFSKDGFLAMVSVSPNKVGQHLFDKAQLQPWEHAVWRNT